MTHPSDAAAPPDGAGAQAAPPPRPERAYQYYDLLMVAFVTVMLCSNLISAQKQATLAGTWLGDAWKSMTGAEMIFGAGVIFFPISYVFGDVLTEVYGYARSRKVVWAGFAASLFAAVMSFVTVSLPPDAKWTDQLPPGLQAAKRQAETGDAAAKADFDRQLAAFRAAPPEQRWTRQQIWESVFGSTWRIVLGSLAGFLVGELANSYTLAKLKIITRGRHLWVRTIASTIVGELVDSAVFLHVAFLGTPGWTWDRVLAVMTVNYLFKVANEIIMTPFTYAIVGFLKRAENEDYYDYTTDFTPFSLKT